MNDSLAGVIIGGFISLVGPAAKTWFDEKKLRQERKLAFLKDRREKYQILFNKTREQLIDGMTEDSFDINFLAQMTVAFPQNVRDAFEQYVSTEGKTIEQKRESALQISIEIEKSLLELDKEIANLFE